MLDTPQQMKPKESIAQKSEAPSKTSYVWISILLLLVLSVVGVGAYIIDAGSHREPSQVETLLTPTPHIPGLQSPPTIVPTLLPEASDSANMATPSGRESL